MALSDEYAKLVEFLDSQELEQKIESKKKADKEKEKISKKTDEIVASCKKSIFSDSPGKQYHISSDGFNVSDVENLMRVKLIDNHVKMQSYERPYISVTELCTCIRSCYYVRKKYQVNLKEQFSFSYLWLIQKIGNSVHDAIQELYNFTEIEKTIVSERYKVKGRIDGIKDKYLYEIKTIDQDKFKGTYLQDHYDQSCIYAYILNSEYNYEIKNICLVYVLRNLKKIASFDLELNDNVAISLLENAIILKECLNKNIVPEPIGATIEKCKFCSYKKYCKDDDSELNRPFMEGNKKGSSDSKFVLLI